MINKLTVFQKLEHCFLNEMIVEVNHSDNLLPNEILSDKTYVYNIQTDELKIAS